MSSKMFVVVLISLSVCGCVFNEEEYERGRDELRQRAFAGHPEWPEEFKKDIMNHVVAKGMTAEQVHLAWDFESFDLVYEDSSGYTHYDAFVLGGMLPDGREIRRTRFSLLFYRGKLERWSSFP
jgi:hypothetical protein